MALSFKFGMRVQRLALNGAKIMKIQDRGVRVKKINHCYTPVCDAKIYEPKKDSQELCKAGQFIVEQYFPYEPILFANQIRPTQTLIQYYQAAANQGRLLYAIVETQEGNEKLGMIITHPLSRTAAKDLLLLAERVKNKGTRNYMTLLGELEKKKDVIGLYNTDRVVSIDILVTHVDFRRRQVSQMLLDAAIKAAEKEGQHVLKIITANEYAVKAASKLGFTSIYQGEVETLRDSKGEALMPNQLCHPHKRVQIMILDLRKAQKKVKEEPVCTLRPDLKG